MAWTWLPVPVLPQSDIEADSGHEFMFGPAEVSPLQLGVERLPAIAAGV